MMILRTTLSHWGKDSLRNIAQKGIEVFDLNREKANNPMVNSILEKKKPGLVIFNGHGSDDIVSGHKDEPLVTAGKNEAILKNKITYAISCRSAKILGPKSIEAGAKSYIGYDDDFIFFYDENKMTHPIDDDTAGLFLEPSNELIISLIKDNSAGESCKRSRQHFWKNIRRLLSSKATKEETGMARYLWWNMRHQVCLGDKDAVFD